MAEKKKKKVVKKNKYSRKPATVSGTALKGIAKVAREAVDAGKRMSYKGKATKTAKDIMVLKAVTDPADKVAIKAARSAKGKKELLNSKASQNAIIKNTKNVGKRASKESQKAFNERAMKAQKSQDVQKMKDKNQITKSKILAKREARKNPAKPPVIKKYVRKGDTPPAVPKKASPAINERRMNPDKGVADLKPVGKTNIKAKEVKAPVKGKVTKAPVKKMSKGKKVAIGAGVAGAGVLLNAKNKKDNKKKAVVASSAVAIAKKAQAKGQVKTPKAAQIKSGRNEFSKKVKPEAVKQTGKAPSTSDAMKKVLSSPKLKGKKIAPKVKSEAIAKARAYIAKNKKSNIPWEKILESITMLMSSHILSKGISKRYK